MANAYSPDVFGRQAEEVRAIFGDLEIVESTTDFLLYVTVDEHQFGVRGDPHNCMFSKACKRAFGSKSVLFYPTVAYVDTVDPRDRGRRIVMRFLLPAETRKQLEDFDAGVGPETGPAEASFILKAVSRSSTLAATAKRSRARRRKNQLEPAEMTQKKSEAAKKGHESRRSKTLMGVRSGAGQVRTHAGD